MSKNSELRKEVRLLKAIQGITYKELADYLEIKQGSFLGWLHNRYDLSEANQIKLKDIIDTLKE